MLPENFEPPRRILRIEHSGLFRDVFDARVSFLENDIRGAERRQQLLVIGILGEGTLAGHGTGQRGRIGRNLRGWRIGCILWGWRVYRSAGCDADRDGDPQCDGAEASHGIPHYPRRGTPGSPRSQ